MSTRDREIPEASYRSISCCALVMEAWQSKDSRASTSVDTLPGMTFRISVPNATARLSMPMASCYWLLPVPIFAITASTIDLYPGICAAFRSSDGLVVASSGAYWLIASKSPVSATTVVICLSCVSLLFLSGVISIGIFCFFQEKLIVSKKHYYCHFYTQ